MFTNNIKKSISILLIAIACLFTNLVNIPPAIASQSNPTNQSNNQDLNLPAILAAPDRNFHIKVYAQPNDINFKNELGYGLAGDPVTLIEKVGSNNDQSWYLVKFNNAPKPKGWINGNYISRSSPDISSERVEKYIGSQDSNSQNQNNRPSQQNKQNSYHPN